MNLMLCFLMIEGGCMFIGVDHGTNAMRFACIDDLEVRTFEIPRADFASLCCADIIDLMLDRFETTANDIGLIALTYSMGDGITAIEDIQNVGSRGVVSIEGAGKKTGAGTMVFDAIKDSGIPAILIPGIHSGSNTDMRLNIFSHSTSPEKIGIAYNASLTGVRDLIICDISSNTVTLAVADGRVIGALDACIFAPGSQHGPLDLQAIRDVDAGKITANQAFMNAGVLKRTPFSNTVELVEAAKANDEQALLALDTIALLSAMEISSMQILLKDYCSQGKVFLAGSIGEVDHVIEKISDHLDTDLSVLGKWSAAIGCAQIARAIGNGAEDILGLPVHFIPDE